METVRRPQRIFMDLIAGGKYFLFLQRLVDDEIYRLKISNRHFGLRMKIAEQFWTVLWKETRRRIRDSSSSIFFSKFLAKRIIEVELKHFSSITRTKQSFLTICIRNKETEHKKKISTREKKKAQNLKLLKRFWDLR